MDRSSLRWKSQEVSWASQSDLLMEMFCSAILLIASIVSVPLINGICIICPGLKSNVGDIYFKNAIDALELISPITESKSFENPIDPLEANRNPLGEYLTEILPLLIADQVAPC